MKKFATLRQNRFLASIGKQRDTCPGHDVKPPGKASVESTLRTPRLSHNNVIRRRAKVSRPMYARRTRMAAQSQFRAWLATDLNGAIREVADETKTA